MIEIDDTVSEVRQKLDETKIAGNLSVYEEDYDDIFSSKFSDQDLRDRVLDGARFISARVKSMHQPDNVRELSSNTTGEIDTSNNKIVNDPNGDNIQPIIRVLNSRVEVGGTDAQRRTLLGNQKIEDTGRAATESEPAYVYEDFEFIVEQGSGTGDVTVDAVNLIEPTNASFDGVAWTYNDGGTSEVPLPDFLQEALVQYVAYTCYATIRASEMAKFARNKMIEEVAPYALPGVFATEDSE